MTLSLNDIRLSVSRPPRIVVYGVPGIGKTTFAAGAPNPVFLPVEDGCGELGVPTLPQPKAYEQVEDSIRLLLTEEHGFETLVVDSLDKIEPLLWDYVCRTEGKKNIEDFGFGKGYVRATGEWNNLLRGFDALRDRGMSIVLIAHSAVVRVEPPETDPFDRYQMRLHKQADATVCDWADAVLFANYKVTTIASGPQGSERKRGLSDGTRLLHTTERAAWRAKNRYRLPDSLPLSWAELQKHLPARAASPATEPAATT